MARHYLIKPNSVQHTILRIHAEHCDWVKDSVVRNDPRVSISAQTHFSNTHAYRMSEYDLTKVGSQGVRDRKTHKVVGGEHWRMSIITDLGLTALRELDLGRVWNGDLKRVDLDATLAYERDLERKSKLHNTMGSARPLPGREKRIWIWHPEFYALQCLITNNGQMSGSQILDAKLHGPIKALVRYQMTDLAKFGRRTTYSITEAGRRAYEVMLTGVPFNTFLNGPDYRDESLSALDEMVEFMDKEWVTDNPKITALMMRVSPIHRAQYVAKANKVHTFQDRYRGGAIPRNAALKVVEVLRRLKRGPALDAEREFLIDLLDKVQAEPTDQLSNRFNRDDYWEALRLLFANPETEKKHDDLAERYMLAKLSQHE